MNFIIQKLKNKHIFLKKLSNWAKLNSLILREREETITKYFAPRWSDIKIGITVNYQIYTLKLQSLVNFEI